MDNDLYLSQLLIIIEKKRNIMINGKLAKQPQLTSPTGLETECRENAGSNPQE